MKSRMLAIISCLMLCIGCKEDRASKKGDGMSSDGASRPKQEVAGMIQGDWYHGIGLDFENRIFSTVNPDNPHVGVSPDVIEPLSNAGITKFVQTGHLVLGADGRGTEVIEKTFDRPMPPDVIDHYQLEPGSKITIEVTLSTSFTWELGERSGYTTLVYNLDTYESRTTGVLVNGQDASKVLNAAPRRADVTPEMRQGMVQVIIDHYEDMYRQDSSSLEEGTIMMKYIRDARADSLVVDTGDMIYEMTRDRDIRLTH